MKFVTRRDYTLGSEFAYDEDKKQQVIIKYTCQKVLNEGIVTQARVIGKTDHKFIQPTSRTYRKSGRVNAFTSLFILKKFDYYWINVFTNNQYRGIMYL